MTRKSRREIEQGLEDIEEGPPGDYPAVSLPELFAYDWEVVDEARRLERQQETEKIYYIPEFGIE